MKSLMRSASVVSVVVGLVAFAGTANALTVSIASQVTGAAYGGPDSFPIAAPTSTTGVFGSSNLNTPTISINPFGSNPADFYYVLSQSGVGAGTATYDIAGGSTNFSLLWGSPDTYNSIKFCTGLDGGGTCVTISPTVGGTFSATSSGYDLIDFTSDVAFNSVILADSGQAAFEWSNVTVTPLPAALPLFAGGLGLLGFLGRKKRRAAVSALGA